MAVGDHVVGHLWIVDAIGGDQRDLDLAHQPLGDVAESRTWHSGVDGRHAGFVPADAGVDDGGTGLFNFLG